MAKAPATKKKAVVKKTTTKRNNRPTRSATKVEQTVVTRAPQKNAFEEKFGEGTAFDLDYGKLVIIGLLIYVAFFK